jgi:hypothetical protein
LGFWGSLNFVSDLFNEEDGVCKGTSELISSQESKLLEINIFIPSNKFKLLVKLILKPEEFMQLAFLEKPPV